MKTKKQENTLKKWFTAKESAVLSGLTRTMIDYLCRIELVCPQEPVERHKGHPRQYSFADVVILRAVSRMLNAGLTVKRLKDSFAELADNRGMITPDALPANLLVSDGKTVYFWRTEDVLEEIANGQLTFAFVLEMSEIRREVVEQLIVETHGENEFSYQLKPATKSSGA